MKLSHPTLSIQGKRRNPSPHEDLFVKIATGAFITLTSPIWFPLWILLLPFKRRRERRKREEDLAQAVLRAKMPPPPPPPPTDPELLRRRELARQTNIHTHLKIRHFYNPIRDNPDIGPIIKAAAERAQSGSLGRQIRAPRHLPSHLATTKRNPQGGTRHHLVFAPRNEPRRYLRLRHFQRLLLSNFLKSRHNPLFAEI